MSRGYHYPQKHLLTTKDLTREDITGILDVADKFVDLNRKKEKRKSLLNGRTLINVFFENSTRTRTSFELAGKRLGADVINMEVSTSAVAKGETLLDTAATLNAMHPDFLSVRHQDSGAVQLLSKKVNCSVINAGDGTNEHPTQALLDALTIRRKLQKNKKDKNPFEGKIVAICGDIRHSRVARSNIHLLKTMGAKVRIVAPKTLLPPFPECLGAEVYTDMCAGIKKADIVMMLRVQKERMNGAFFPSEAEYFRFYGLDHDKLSHAKKNVIVMHPGPINRGLEIDTALADDMQYSVILDQVEMGVAVRQAMLELLGRHYEKKS